MNDVSYLTRKGQTTIPAHIRKELGLKQGQGLRYELNKKTKEIKVKPLTHFDDLLGCLKSDIKWDPVAAEQAIFEAKRDEYREHLKRIGIKKEKWPPTLL